MIIIWFPFLVGWLLTGDSHHTRKGNASKFVKTFHVKFFPFGQKWPACRVTVNIIQLNFDEHHWYSKHQFTKNGDSDVSDLMMVTILRCWWQKKYYDDIFLHVGDIPIGHEHHNMLECDVGDWYWMFVPNSWCWWRNLSPTSKSCHQHIWSPTSITNIDETQKIIEHRPCYSAPSVSLNGYLCRTKFIIF